MKNSNATTNKFPEIGAGVTIIHWTDREPATIIGISASARRITIQVDKSIRIDRNGMSEMQEYRYDPDPEGAIFVVSLRADGNWRIAKSNTTVSLYGRRKYHDYSF